jgi:hypothetical protein
MNGTTTNGTALNGTTPSGTAVNGTTPNGTHNRTEYNVEAVKTTAIGPDDIDQTFRSGCIGVFLLTQVDKQ